MIITCPKCSISYRVGMDAISGRGRIVRCTKCGESWKHQIGERSIEIFDSIEQEKKVLDPEKDQKTGILPRPEAQLISASQTNMAQQQALPMIEKNGWICAILWFGIISFFVSACAGVYWKRDLIIDKFPGIQPYLELFGLKTREMRPFFRISGTKLRWEKRGVIAGQVVDFAIENLTNQIRQLPRAKAIFLDSNRNILESWKISLQGNMLKPGEKKLFSKKIKRSLPAARTLKIVLSTND